MISYRRGWPLRLLNCGKRRNGSMMVPQAILPRQSALMERNDAFDQNREALNRMAAVAGWGIDQGNAQAKLAAKREQEAQNQASSRRERGGSGSLTDLPLSLEPSVIRQAERTSRRHGMTWPDNMRASFSSRDNSTAGAGAGVVAGAMAGALGGAAAGAMAGAVAGAMADGFMRGSFTLPDGSRPSFTLADSMHTSFTMGDGQQRSSISMAAAAQGVRAGLMLAAGAQQGSGGIRTSLSSATAAQKQQEGLCALPLSLEPSVVRQQERISQQAVRGMRSSQSMIAVAQMEALRASMAAAGQSESGASSSSRSSLPSGWPGQLNLSGSGMQAAPPQVWPGQPSGMFPRVGNAHQGNSYSGNLGGHLSQGNVNVVHSSSGPMSTRLSLPPVPLGLSSFGGGMGGAQDATGSSSAAHMGGGAAHLQFPASQGAVHTGGGAASHVLFPTSQGAVQGPQPFATGMAQPNSNHGMAQPSQGNQGPGGFVIHPGQDLATLAESFRSASRPLQPTRPALVPGNANVSVSRTPSGAQPIEGNASYGGNGSYDDNNGSGMQRTITGPGSLSSSQRSLAKVGSNNGRFVRQPSGLSGQAREPIWDQNSGAPHRAALPGYSDPVLTQGNGSSSNDPESRHSEISAWLQNQAEQSYARRAAIQEPQSFVSGSGRTSMPRYVESIPSMSPRGSDQLPAEQPRESQPAEAMPKGSLYEEIRESFNQASSKLNYLPPRTPGTAPLDVQSLQLHSDATASLPVPAAQQARSAGQQQHTSAAAAIATGLVEMNRSAAASQHSGSQPTASQHTASQHTASQHAGSRLRAEQQVLVSAPQKNCIPRPPAASKDSFVLTAFGTLLPSTNAAH